MKTNWRKQTLIRDGYKCVLCNSIKRIHVHHKDESRKLGKNKINNNLDNLITLCFVCHLKVHKKVPAFIHTKKIISLRRIGLSMKEIADDLDIGMAAVAFTLKKASLKDKSIEKDCMENWPDNYHLTNVL